MYKSEVSSKDYFLKKTKAAREERAIDKERENAACCIQKNIRIWLSHLHFTTETLEKFDAVFCNDSDDIKSTLRPAIQIYDILTVFLIVYKKERDKTRMENLCKYLIRSLDSDSPTYSCIGVALLKHRSIFWITQMKKILVHCLNELTDLHPEQPDDYKSILLRLHTLVSFTSIGTWTIMNLPEMKKLKAGMNQVCSNIMGHLVNNCFYHIMQTLLYKSLHKRHTVLQPVALTAITTLTIRPLILSKMSEKLLLSYLVHIFSTPALLHLIAKEDQTSYISLYKNSHFFSHCMDFLTSEMHLKTIFHTLKGNYALCLLANFIELANIESDEFSKEINFSHFIFIVSNLLQYCQQYVVAKKSNTTYWHPILGWFEQPEDNFQQEMLPLVKIQLSYLWSGNLVTKLVCEPLSNVVDRKHVYQSSSQSIFMNTKTFCRGFMEFYSRKNFNNARYRKLNGPQAVKIASVCSLYNTGLRTLREMKSIIFTGLCYKDKRILYNLWLFLDSIGPYCGLKAFLDQLSTNPDCITPEFQILIFFCDCMTHYITILDDIEMYEKQDPFRLSDFICMSAFLNQFLYKSIINDLFDIKTVSQNQLFISLHTFLMAIYRRDCQKTFCTRDHWLAKEIRASSFLSDLEKGKQSAVFLLSKMPHILPHSERVILFRKNIVQEKTILHLNDNTCNNSRSTLITVQRSRILEDGYRQLSMLSSQILKGAIRVKFINEQGLDEAGIDQDGVFKEFLEETIKKIFDPSLNLFKVTSENRLYPSPTSFMQDNHLLLFEFVGRMLAKAIYEGIVVDIPFASFFVSQFCGQAGGVLYSWLDELASLDQDLYRSLTMVKHYDGDISELELTFSLNESIMGKVVTFELKPGGKAIPVTNENKINYIHLMARFRMYDQIKDQIAAFTKGFRTIINSDWLSLFSAPEWQRLISGDNIPLNLRDLRKHTQYYGGFHDKHRVVCWLWDILEKDFSEIERSLFLKFVTSCSKSPLLGFAHLDPPFSIRCIEVGDDEDNGDTIGSVIRGFFTIHKKDPQNRLPTSSTCFNLLKLPNYQRKCTLREKLRYAITSNTGFELS